MPLGILRVDLDAGQEGTPFLSGTGSAWSGAGVIGNATTSVNTGIEPAGRIVPSQGLTALDFSQWTSIPGIFAGHIHWKATPLWDTLGTPSNVPIHLYAGTAIDTWPSFLASIELESTVPNTGQQTFVSPEFMALIGGGLLAAVLFEFVLDFHYQASVDELFVLYDVFPVLDPFSGSTAGGDLVIINGAGLSGVSTVEFDGISATSVTVISDFQVSCITPAHAAGTVTVTLNGTDYPDSYTYSTPFLAAPTINPGPPQAVFGPPPSTLTTAATVTPGSGNIASYLWTFEDGPSAPTIVSPTDPNTDVTFAAYATGTYRLRLTVTSDDDPSFTIFDFAYFIIAPTVAPRIENGSRNIFFSDGVALDPTITDDGWGGALSYLWTQLSGPDTATIVSPTLASSDFTFPEVAGVYLFQLTVTRDDALVGTGVWRVAVFTDAQEVEDLQTGPVSLLVNGVEDFAARLDTTRISKALGSTTTAAFEFYDHDIARFSSIVIERGSRRLFGDSA
jgi:hypothetical protein